LDIGYPGMRPDPANARQDAFYAPALAGAIASRFRLLSFPQVLGASAAGCGAA
jgi:hypothetical protein